jgi:hypothetical protein
MSRGGLRALEQDTHGQRGARSREHPDAIIPDLSKPNPVFSFNKDDVAFTYGSRWKQRYFKQNTEDWSRRHENESKPS